MTDASQKSEKTDKTDKRLGEVIQGKYKVIRKIGAGGMGAVYEGEHSMIGRRVAIKFLHSDFAENEDVKERFLREARAATSIGHEHIVEVTDMGILDDGAAFMVLEYLEGRPLDDEIEKKGPMSVGRVARIAGQVCEALAAAHAKGIVHRDMKPANVFLINRGGSSDFVKVLDFGVAKLNKAGEENHTLTQTGATIGTPAYMSPEQAHGAKNVDHRADIYSLGVVLFETLTGARPFQGESMVSLLMAVCFEPPPPLAAFRADLPEAIEAIVAKAMAKDPAERYQGCLELKADLDRLVGEPEVPAVLVPRPAAPSEPKSTVATKGAKAPARTVAAATGGAKAASPPSGSLPPTVVASVAAAAPERTRRWVLPAIVGGVLVAAGLAAAAVLGLSGGDAAEERGEPAAQTDPPPAQTEKVRIQISTVPAGAELLLDGEPIANPFDAEVPARPEPRVLEARLQGYQPMTKRLSLGFAQQVRLELTALAPAATPVTPPATAELPPGPATPTSRPRTPSAPTKTTPVAAAPPPPTPVQPTPPVVEPAKTAPAADAGPTPLKRVAF